VVSWVRRLSVTLSIGSIPAATMIFLPRFLRFALLFQKESHIGTMMTSMQSCPWFRQELVLDCGCINITRLLFIKRYPLPYTLLWIWMKNMKEKTNEFAKMLFVWYASASMLHALGVADIKNIHYEKSYEWLYTWKLEFFNQIQISNNANGRLEWWSGILYNFSFTI
jgi:hypothetical protein